MTARGKTVVRGGFGKFYAYVPVVLDLTHQQSGVLTLYPDVDGHATRTARCSSRT